MAKGALKGAGAAQAAETEVQAVKEETAKEPASKNGGKIPQDPVYSAGELASGAKEIFQTRPECVLAALRAAGKEKCTVCEAKKIVEKFLKRAVQ